MKLLLLCLAGLALAKDCDKNATEFAAGALAKANSTKFDGGSDLLGLEIDVSLDAEDLREITTFEDLEEHLRISDGRKVCLENVTKCAEEDELFVGVSDKIAKALFSLSPPFDLSKLPGVSSGCQLHSTLFREELQRLHLWALKMYDSTAKFPSGLLNGNVNQLGDFDQCLSVKSDHDEVRGKYCLAYMQVEVPDSPYLSVMHKLTHSHSPFRSHMNDPGHRVPRYSTINWAVCIPDTCTAQDVENGIRHYIAETLTDFGVQVQVQMNKEMCQSGVKKPLPMSTIIGASFFLSVIALTIAATIYDYREFENKNQYFVAFSLRKNMSSLFSLERSEGDMPSVHGIRFLNAFMLLMAHKSMALFFNPYVNRTEMSEYLGQPWSVIGRAASLYTDPFIMLSGMLTTYSFLGRLNRNQNINIFKEYVSRLFRLVPTLGALILFCTLVLPWLGSGPQWNLVVTHHSEICKTTWWRNLLFIHNYFGFKNMCLTHTHHVGIDTQLFAFSPLMVWLIWKWPRKGIAVLLSLATISTCMRYYVTYTRKLSNYVHFGTSITQLFDTADYMYILPAHRLTVYIMGVMLAYILRTYKKITLEPMYLKAGNALALLMFCVAFFGPAYMGSIHYKYNPTDAAWYAAFAPIAWCFSFGWIIYSSHHGYEGVVGRFFSWRGFLVSTRLSYAIYLTQFPVFFYNVGITRSSEQYTFFRLQFNISEVLNIVMYSIILTLLFDSPFQNIKNILFKRKQKSEPNKIAAAKKIA